MRFILPKRAVRAFLNRKRRDYHTWKKLTKEEIEEKRLQLPIRPPIWSKLKKHQKVCFLLAAWFGRFFFINDTGTGKTLLSIALAAYFHKADMIDRALVLVPNRANKWEWRREIRKHAPDLPHLVLTGSSSNKWGQLADNPDAVIVIETYAGFVRMVTKAEKRKRKKGNRLVPYRPYVKEVQRLFQMLVMDEAHTAKNPKKLPYRIANAISKEAESVVALTATPFGRNPEDIWSQFFLVDRGYTLGETLGLFRAAFFKGTDNYWGGIDWKFDRKKERQLHQFMRNRSIRYEANAADLPRVVPIYKAVSLPTSAEEYYERAKATLFASRGNYQEMKNAFLRMRQISSGFVGFKDDETGDKAQFIFPEKPKLELLLSTIESIPQRHKILVFTEFNFSGELIRKELAEREINCAHVYGKTKNQEAELERVINEKNCQVLILGATGRMGLNMQIFRYGMFYESPVSPILRKQSERRVERQYSEHDKVFMYDFVTRGTADESILRFHAEGADLFKAIVDGRARSL